MQTTRQLFTQYLLKCNKLQILAESLRQNICLNPYFQPLSVFERIDKFKKGYLEPADLSEFMLQNKVYPTESELYLIFRDFDRERRGVVTLDQFQEQILPRENRKQRKDAIKRNPYPVEFKLSVDLEYLLGKYFENKIKQIKQLSILREKIKLSKSYAVDDCFLEIDLYRTGAISGKEEIDGFLRRNGKALNHQQLLRIYRVLSFNTLRPITLHTFKDHLAPFDQEFYPGYIQKVREKQAIQYRFLEKKYEIESLYKDNIIKREQLTHDIVNLRESNRRLRGIIQQQQVHKLSQYRPYNPYY